MGDLSPHFSSTEFRDHRTGELPAGYPDRGLVQVLERLRSEKGDRPLRIVSGYRSAATNRAVGGAPNSQHLVGRAADIPAGYATVREALRAGAVGVGYDKRGWAVHLDTRSSGGPVTFRDG